MKARINHLLVLLSILPAACASDPSRRPRPAEEARTTETTGAMFGVPWQRPGPVVTMESRQGESPKPTTLLPLGDDQIVEVLRTAHATEIEQSRLADNRIADPTVRRYADILLKSHSEGDARADQIARKKGLEPKSSPTCALLQAEGARATALLSDQFGDDFDRRYVDAQVREHQALLDLIDTKLDPNAQASEVRLLLVTARAETVRHLAGAKELQKTLVAR